uniref:Uncharacterized protein n=1 Tax=Daucus carota subsp. sativus TaxID=79200 RepID=A0A161ZUG3_DAUCS
MKNKVLSKLVSGSGVDAGEYGQDYSHIIVYNLLYIFPLIEKYKIGHLNRIGAHLANNSQPLEMQKLQC